MPSLDYMHVDVFSDLPFSGNSLAVFYDCADLSAEAMLRITQELRHFETIFLRPTSDPALSQARIFDLFEELPFAGHPILGAAAVLQHRSGSQDRKAWNFDLGGRTVSVEVEPTDGRLAAILDQGVPAFVDAEKNRRQVAQAFSLDEADVIPELPLEVVTTGLRYLIVPVTSDAIGRARVAFDLTDLVNSFGAQFAVLLDPEAMEVRHWNNDGIIEDVATGSAAGTIAAYCVKHGIRSAGARIALAQGHRVGRPSRITAWRELNDGPVKVAGGVSIVGEGRLYSSPGGLS